MNYDLMLTDIEEPRQEYPNPSNPEIAKRFKSLEEYLVIAKKVIKTFAPKYLPAIEVQKMVNSENAVSEIARHLMMADWRYKDGRGRTEHSYRNQCGDWAIQDFLGLSNTKANQSNYSLDISVGDGPDAVPLSSITEDTLVKEPIVIVKENERKERVRKYIAFLIQNSKLTSVQAKCIQLRYIEGIESHTEIGQRFDPPISRQAVKQNIDRSLYKLRQTSLGTKT